MKVYKVTVRNGSDVSISIVSGNNAKQAIDTALAPVTVPYGREITTLPTEIDCIVLFDCNTSQPNYIFSVDNLTGE
jgi:hypothetical protein